MIITSVFKNRNSFCFHYDQIKTMPCFCCKPAAVRTIGLERKGPGVEHDVNLIFEITIKKALSQEKLSLNALHSLIIE